MESLRAGSNRSLVDFPFGCNSLTTIQSYRVCRRPSPSGDRKVEGRVRAICSRESRFAGHPELVSARSACRCPCKIRGRGPVRSPRLIAARGPDAILAGLSLSVGVRSRQETVRYITRGYWCSPGGSLRSARRSCAVPRWRRSRAAATIAGVICQHRCYTQPKCKWSSWVSFVLITGAIGFPSVKDRSSLP